MKQVSIAALAVVFLIAGCGRGGTAGADTVEKRIIVLYQEQLKKECRVSETQMTNIRASITRVFAAHPVSYADIAEKEKALRAALARSPVSPADVAAALDAYTKIRERYRIRGEELARAVDVHLSAEQKARFVLFQKDFYTRLRALAAKAKHRK